MIPIDEIKIGDSYFLLKENCVCKHDAIRVTIIDISEDDVTVNEEIWDRWDEKWIFPNEFCKNDRQPLEMFVKHYCPYLYKSIEDKQKEVRTSEKEKWESCDNEKEQIDKIISDMILYAKNRNYNLIEFEFIEERIKKYYPQF